MSKENDLNIFYNIYPHISINIMTHLVSLDAEKMEPPEVIDYWRSVCSSDEYFEPTFQNFDTLSRELSSKICCLYIISKEDDKNDDYIDETLVLIGQDFLDSIDEMIPGTDIMPKTSHIKAFEHFKKHRRDFKVLTILGFYFDTIDGKFDSCVNGIRNYFTSRSISQQHIQSLSKLVIPKIRQLVLAENITIRCNYRGINNKRCKRTKKGSFYCFQHQPGN